MVNDKDKEKEEVLIKTADVYYTLNLKAHIRLKGEGFINGWIISPLQEIGSFYWIKDIRYPEEKSKIYLWQIYDIKDYKENKEEIWTKNI